MEIIMKYFIIIGVVVFTLWAAFGVTPIEQTTTILKYFKFLGTAVSENVDYIKYNQEKNIEEYKDRWNKDKEDRAKEDMKVYISEVRNNRDKNNKDLYDLKTIPFKTFNLTVNPYGSYSDHILYDNKIKYYLNKKIVEDMKFKRWFNTLFSTVKSEYFYIYNTESSSESPIKYSVLNIKTENKDPRMMKFFVMQDVVYATYYYTNTSNSQNIKEYLEKTRKDLIHFKQSPVEFDYVSFDLARDVAGTVKDNYL
jgi:hypothetical protein